jgi:hypothetical protein
MRSEIQVLPEQPDEAAADFPRAVIIVLRNDHGAIALADRDQMKRRREAAARDERDDELGEAVLIVRCHPASLDRGFNRDNCPGLRARSAGRERFRPCPLESEVRFASRALPRL